MVYEYIAKIINVVDGDTVDAEIDLGFSIKVTDRFRIKDIDAPEKRGIERPDGLISTDWLIDRILGKEVTIKTYKRGKYGRYIAEIFLDDVNIGMEMVEQKMAEFHEY